MHHMKRYVLLAVILGIACVFKFNNFGRDYEMVGSFRGAQLESEDWNPLIADSVNQGNLSVLIDNKEYNNRDNGIFMDYNLNLMVPTKILTDGFNCSSHLYDKEHLLVEKRSDEVTFGLNDPVIEVDGKTENLSSPMTEVNGEYYVSISDLSKNLGYSYDWDIEDNQAVASDTSEINSILPSSYDLRDKKRIGRIKNQGATGTCWAFASLSALESELLPEEDYDLSPNHMSLCNSFAVNEQDGGEYTMSMAYLLSWQGPVYEKAAPFGEGEASNDLSPVKHVQEVQMIEGKDYEKIKESVFKYGGVQTSLYSTLKSSSSESTFYNRQKQAYCYIGTEKPNHEVVIIGWDDNYSKDNFSVGIEGDGAFICQNSWGDKFGDEGVFYVSYYDTNIGSHNIVYTKVENTDNFDNIYQSDLCGWVGQMGFDKSFIYGANVYTAETAQTLSAAGFYATGKDTEYMLYVVKDYKDQESLNKKERVAQGKLSNAGYYTIDFERDISLKEGERFAIVLYINTPNTVHPMAIEYAADEATKDVDLSDGEGYISSSGDRWERVEDTAACNLCLKAYTADK